MRRDHLPVLQYQILEVLVLPRSPREAFGLMSRAHGTSIRYGRMLATIRELLSKGLLAQETAAEDLPAMTRLRATGEGARELRRTREYFQRLIEDVRGPLGGL